MMDNEQEKRMNTTSAVIMEDPESTTFEDEEEYVPIDLCANIDYTDEPRPDSLTGGKMTGIRFLKRSSGRLETPGTASAPVAMEQSRCSIK